MIIGAFVNCFESITHIYLEKKGDLIHVLFSKKYGAMIPALDVAAVAFPEYKRQDGGTRPPRVTGEVASQWTSIQFLQSFWEGQQLVNDVYFSGQQKCQKFPLKMELCTVKDLQKLQKKRETVDARGNKTRAPERQLRSISKMIEILTQVNKQHNTPVVVDPVSVEEYNKLLKEVQYYRQYFAKTAEIRQLLGIVFDSNNNAKAV